MKKRVFALLLATSMMAALVAGCGNKATESSENKATESSENKTTESTDSTAGTVGESTATDGPITFPLAETKEFSMLCVINGDTPMDQVDAFKHLNEQSNITFDVNSVPLEDAAEKEGLILAAGDYPDVFIFSSLQKNNIEDYGSQGVFIPLEDYIRTQAPNLTKLLDERNLWPYITSADGHVYSLPALNTGAELEAGFHVWLNYQWLDNLGMSEPKSLDELYNVLLAFKEKDANGNGDLGDEIPLSVPDGMSYIKNYLPYFGYNLDSDTWLANQDGNLVYVPTDDGYKEFLRYFTKLYNEGLLDSSSFTQNYDQLAAQGSSGDILGCFSALASFQFSGRELDENYQILTPFEGQVYPQSTGIGHGNMMITDACQDPATLVAWADQLYTQEGGVLYWLGIEGNSFILNDDKSWAWNIGGPIGDDISTIREKGTLKYQTAFPGVQPDFWFTGITDPDESYLISQRSKMLDYGKITLPAMTYSVEETETIATVKADIDSYIDQYGAQVITGEKDLDDSWDEYVSQMNTMGASELFGIYKRAFDNAK